MILTMTIPMAKSNRSRCIVCKKKRPPIAILHEDPHCSNVCARITYGNPMPESMVHAQNYGAGPVRKYYEKPKGRPPKHE